MRRTRGRGRGRGGDAPAAHRTSPSPAAPATIPPAPLPAGSVTFLMSDIEGSTRLFHRLGSTYVRLLAEHRSLLRAAVAAHGGVEVETEGDALLIAFADAADGVAAALDVQRSLSAHRWPAGGEIRVRLGLHTGEAAPVGNGYVALAVHQVARICASAHGGQVVLSAATAAAVGARLPAGADVVALGSFQLRGFPAPERLFQLQHADLREDFPPLRALGVVAHNLPFVRSSFVGRSEERATLAALLPDTGVVTVVGPGGVGKTRLAVQVAFDLMDDYPDGAWMVELAPISDPALVARAVAAAVRVPEQPGRSIDDVLLDALAPRALLLVLDNAEHLLDAVAALVERLSQRCPHLAVLVTSREPLDIDGEAVCRLAPLSIVDPDRVSGAADVTGADAVRLFADRAALVRPGFVVTDDTAADVARLVGQLDGIPLAIELAAAALVDRPLSAVLSGLTDRFSLLARGRRGAPGRHQTLRAALEWSLDLLDPDERRVFARLAAFAGGGTFEAAAEVCAVPPVDGGAVPAALRRLIRASLLVPHTERAERWSIPESVRELAAAELAAAGETELLAARHRDRYVRWVEAVEDDIGRADRADVMRDLTLDHDNVRRALDTAAAAGDVRAGLRLATAMAPYWTSAGHWTEGSERLRSVLALTGQDAGPRARALVAAGQLMLLRGRLDEAAAQYAEARDQAAAADDDVALARALSGAGYVAYRHSRLDESERYWEDALTRAQRAGNERVSAGILRSLAIVAGTRGDQDTAGRLLDGAIVSARRVGDDQLLRQLLGSSAERHLWLGAYRLAEGEYDDALELASSIGDLSARPLLLAELAWVALLRGDVRVAERLGTEAAELAEDLGNRRVLSHALRARGESLLRAGSSAEAGPALDQALAVAEEFGAPAEIAGVRCSQAVAALEQLQLAEARRLAEQSLALSALPHPMRLVAPDWVLGAVNLIEGDLAAAARDFDASRSFAGPSTGPRFLANATWGLACVEAARLRTGEAVASHAVALRLRSEIDDRLGIAESLVGLASAVAALEPEEAARLLGAAAGLRQAAGAVPTPRQERDLAAALQATAGAADGARMARAHDEGAALPVDAVVARAQQLSRRVASAGPRAGSGRPG